MAIVKPVIAFFARPFDPFFAVFVYTLFNNFKCGIQGRIICITDRAKSVAFLVIPDSVFKSETGPYRTIQTKKLFYDSENCIDHNGHIFLSAKSGGLMNLETTMKAQALEQLEQIKHQWIDFQYWASLQLNARGFTGTEDYSKKLGLAEQLHEAREAELKAFNERMEYEVLKMRHEGADSKEINAYRRSRGEELHKLVTAWRSLD
jgi:hypothetical protein